MAIPETWLLPEGLLQQHAGAGCQIPSVESEDFGTSAPV